MLYKDTFVVAHHHPQFFFSLLLNWVFGCVNGIRLEGNISSLNSGPVFRFGIGLHHNVFFDLLVLFHLPLPPLAKKGRGNKMRKESLLVFDSFFLFSSHLRFLSREQIR
jgi:hypothetical protein